MIDTWDGYEKILVCGGRDFADYGLLAKKLDRLTRKFDKFIVLSGAAIGADALGENWAFSRFKTVMRFHPDYEKYGPKKAPHVRNSEMVAYATRCVAFWDGVSDGTAGVIEKARKKGIPVKVIYYGGEK